MDQDGLNWTLNEFSVAPDKFKDNPEPMRSTMRLTNGLLDQIISSELKSNLLINQDVLYAGHSCLHFVRTLRCGSEAMLV